MGLLPTCKVETTTIGKMCLILKLEIATKHTKDMKPNRQE